MVKAVVVAAWLVVSSSVGAATLFPTPLHLVRRIDDPLARSSSIVEEFCAGDRIISISGNRVAITDFAAQTLTEIDHDTATFSITRFDEIAKARSAAPAAINASVEVKADRTVALSRDAVEALVGAAYPNRRDSTHEKILSAVAPAGGRLAAQSKDEAAFALPRETIVTYEEGLTYRNVIIRIDHDPPPSRALLIDPGASRVESRLTRTARELQQLDHPPKQ
jgi:hypothetical protein